MTPHETRETLDLLVRQVHGERGRQAQSPRLQAALGQAVTAVDSGVADLQAPALEELEAAWAAQQVTPTEALLEEHLAVVSEPEAEAPRRRSRKSDAEG